MPVRASLRAARWLALRSVRALRVPQRRIGAPPGSLPDLAAHEREAARLHVLRFEPDGVRVDTTVSPSEAVAATAEPGIAWIDLVGVRDLDALRTLGDGLALHPLVQEDLAHPHQRPKLETYPAGEAFRLFIVARMLRLGPEREIITEQVGFLVGESFLLTVQEREGDVFDPVRERIRQGLGRIRRQGADYLAYALIDVIVDHYFVVLEALSDEIEQLEAEVVDAPQREHQYRIRQLRHSALEIRHAVWPLRDVLNAMLRDDSGLVSDTSRLYLRDAYDHTMQVTELLDGFREVLSGLHDLYLSSLNHRLNEVMKVLTIIGTIFIPLSFLVGIYGMNFEYMPELAWRYGYFAVLGLSGLLIAGSLAFFRWRGWL